MKNTKLELENLSEFILELEGILSVFKDRKETLVKELQEKCCHTAFSEEKIRDYDKNVYLLTCTCCNKVLLNGNVFEKEVFLKNFREKAVKI